MARGCNGRRYDPGVTDEARAPTNAASVVAVICSSLALIVSAVALGIAIDNHPRTSSPPSGAAPAVKPQSVAVSEKEYSITPGAASASPGPVTFQVSNDGNATHELVLVKTDLAEGDLPRGPDGKVDLASSELISVAQVLDIEAGRVATVAATLTPGRYVMICNVTAHYAAGMHSGFTVSGG